MRCIKTILVNILCLLASSILAQDKEKPKKLTLHGYIKDMQTMYFSDNVDSINSSNLVHNRLNFKMQFSSKFNARLEIRNRIFYGDQVEQIPGFGKLVNQYDGYMDLSKLWVDEKTLVIHSVIDRMVVQYAGEKWDVRIGRQRINWGINNTWNPNDLFNAYNFLDFDYEERPGTDAVRVQHFFKNSNAIDFAYKPGRKQYESIAAVMYRFNAKKYDYQVLAGIYNADIVAGGGWAGSIGKAGFKGEVSYFHPRQNWTDSSGTWSISVMADETFKDKWYVTAAFLYNSNPTGLYGTNGTLFAPNLSAKNLFPFRYSFYTSAIYTISPINSATLSLVYSPTNNTLLFFPAFTWNVAQNFDLDMVMQALADNTNAGYAIQGGATYLRVRWSF